jgi:hypothetical protein
VSSAAATVARKPSSVIVEDDAAGNKEELTHWLGNAGGSLATDSEGYVVPWKHNPSYTFRKEQLVVFFLKSL